MEVANIAKDRADHPGEHSSKSRDVMWHGTSAGSIGIEMGLAVAIGVLIGYWLDQKFDTEPAFTLLCMGFGLAAAFKGLLRLVRETQAKARAAEASEDREGEPASPPAKDDTSR